MDSSQEHLVTLYGGPLDGQAVSVPPDDPDPWIAIISPHGAHPGGRSLYRPDVTGCWRWVRDIPWEAL